MKPIHTPQISIIIPVFNREKIMQATLASVAAQTLRPLEVIVVDNNSADNSLAVAQAWAESAQGLDVKVLSCTTPGACNARNAGAAAASGEWLMFFDSDDTMSPDHAERLASAVEANPQAQIIGWDVEIITDSGARRRGRFCRRNALWENLHHGAMSTQRYAMRRSLFEAVGAWDTGVFFWDDIELGMRLLAAKPHLINIGQSGVKVFYQSESITAALDADPSRMEPSLCAIEHTLKSIIGPRGAAWCRLKRAVYLGVYARKGAAAAREGMKKVLSACPTWGERSAVRLAYAMTRAGVPGASSLLYFFYNPIKSR